ncbi:MAG: hypothetical protein O3A63_16130 [Proteobacteria bacterium]|nr:hypothetical protein [Pseudomonadota bacterium]
MIRSPSHRAKFDKLGVPTVLADLEYPIDHAVQACDATATDSIAGFVRHTIKMECHSGMNSSLYSGARGRLFVCVAISLWHQ